MGGTCVVVGHGPGLGAAIARAFAGEGMRLALVARHAGRLEEAAAALSAGGVEAAGFAADAGNERSLLAALAAARARFGDPDVLVYNAAAWRSGPVLAIAADELVEDFRVCAAGALTAARAVVPAMQARGQGSLLFTGGGFALYPSPVAPTLSIGKAAIRSLALMLAQELAPSRVRVGTVTVLGTVAMGTKFDPDAIARSFVALHKGPVVAGTAEVTFA